MESKINIKYSGEDRLFLHKEIGKGKLPDGRECRLIQTNSEILMSVSTKKGNRYFSINYMDLTKAFADIIPKIEKNLRGK